MIVRQQFGSIQSPIEIVDAGGNVVTNNGLAFTMMAGPEGLTLTHITAEMEHSHDAPFGPLAGYRLIVIVGGMPNNVADLQDATL